jgi:hypothetical protein
MHDENVDDLVGQPLTPVPGSSSTVEIANPGVSKFILGMPWLSYLFYAGGILGGGNLGSKNCFVKFWPTIMFSIFFLCLGLCTLRMFVHGPAHYHLYTNGAMVFVHLWLPYGWYATRKIISNDNLNIWHNLASSQSLRKLLTRQLCIATAFAYVLVLLEVNIVGFGWITDFFHPFYIQGSSLARLYGYSSGISFIAITLGFCDCVDIRGGPSSDIGAGCKADVVDTCFFG